MTTYKYLENGGLTQDEFFWFSKGNGGAEPTGAILKCISDDGTEETSYVVFKRNTGKREFNGTVTDWGNDTVLKACYSRYVLISKKTGEVLDNDFDRG